ncbi:MAG: lysophospholipid acyltransferase family protein [Pyrinomonadaceae bacterium]
MTGHSNYPAVEVVRDQAGASAAAPPIQSNIQPWPPPLGRLHYWWSLFVAAALLGTIGPPTITVTWLLGRRHWLYPWCLFGARNWLAWSGYTVRTRGQEHLDAGQPYVFICNHRSYLDTATMFYYTRRRIGIIAKKELLKVPVLGHGMGFVNIMAIDRSNRESALRTMRAATDRIKSGVSFAVFAEGTRAPAGKFLPFKKGAFYMAIEAGVPIVPVAIRNTDRLMGKGTGISRPGVIEVDFLPPIETAGCTTDEEVLALIERVHAEIAKKLGLEGQVSATRKQQRER